MNRMLLWAGALAALALPPGSGSLLRPQALAAQPLPPADASATPHEEPGWFRIQVPGGWRLLADRASGHVALSSNDRQAMHIWMLLVPRNVETQDAAALFGLLSNEVAPGTAWSVPNVTATGGRTTVTALGRGGQGRDGEFVRSGGLSLVRADRVTIALFTMASAPAALFDQNRRLFAATFESFAPLPGRGSGEQSGLAFERWTDPVEHAFSLDVPRGWKVQGGSARKSAVDIRQVVQIVSPDGTVLIQAGDDQVSSFVEPWGFLREGQYSGPAVVLRYRPGAQFGQDYLAFRVRPIMRDMAIDIARPIPQLQQMIQSSIDAFAVPGIERRVDVGELTFHGTWNGKPARGYLYAATQRVASQVGGAMWFTGDLGSLQGFVATEDKLATAIEVMGRMRQSLMLDPNWFGGQVALAGVVSRITTETNAYIQNVITQTYAGTQAANASIYERYSRYQRDVVDLTDPQTRQQYQVQRGSNYYWIDDRGIIAGTNTSFNPDPLWFRRMLMVDP